MSKTLEAAREWVMARLERKLAVGLTALLVIVSTAFLGLFVVAYRNALEEERARVSVEVSGALRLALENAMLKKDLNGLTDIVGRMAELESVLRVLVLNPSFEVRFASDSSLIGQRLDLDPALAYDATVSTAYSGVMIEAPVRTGVIELPAVRAITPVLNRAACEGCHGPASEQPVNGLLLVDIDAGELRRTSLATTAYLSLSGLAVTLLALAAVSLFLRREVLRPVERVAAASRALRGGRLDARAGLVGNDQIAGLGRTFDDMADQLDRTIDALGRRERLLQAIIDASPDGIRVIDANYRVIKANASFARQQDIELDAILGRPCYASSHNRTEPCAPTMVSCPLHELQRSPLPLKCRHLHQRPDGSTLAVEVTAARLADGVVEGEGAWVVEVIRDLQAVAMISQEQRLAEIGQLAAGVAHEIRNPLGAIALGLKALRRELPTGESNAHRLGGYIDLVEDEIGMCIKVTERLLALSVPPSERLVLLELEPIVRDVLALLAFEAEQRGVIVELVFEPRPLRVVARDAELRMLVLNLAQNAFHAMPDGGRFSITGRLADGCVELVFADTGCGIEAADLGRIFQPFFSRRADGDAGCGLGLTICRSIVERYAGSIEVTSRPGSGTVFTVRLPAADTERDGPDGDD
jgi:signal transduction histidine kinase/HAMP domain-containing protein